MSDAREQAVERLAGLLSMLGKEGDAPEIFDGSLDVAEIDAYLDQNAGVSRRSRLHAAYVVAAQNIARTLGLVAVPPDLVAAVRETRAAPDDGTATNEALRRLTLRAKAERALVDSILEQLAPPPAPKPRACLCPACQVPMHFEGTVLCCSECGRSVRMRHG